MILSDGISNVRVFSLPVGVSGDGKSNQLTGFVLVKWQSTYNLPHQVYVNGKFGGATTDTSQRQMIISVPMSQQAAVRIEVYAVDSQNADTDFSELTESGRNLSRVKIEFPKMTGGYIDIYREDEKLTNEAIRISELIGFGLGSFGQSDFGFDGGAASGFGKGVFGCGRFGFDADMFCWQSRQLGTGVHSFKLKITDCNGNQTESATETVTIIQQAKPAGKVTIDSFDKQTNKITLSTL
ncbi:MAG: hypothetical protein LLF92_05330 [Planctomycetaceae bacterium]|nr:hypothetical protein [Planctomycetaceae bacterium]